MTAWTAAFPLAVLPIGEARVLARDGLRVAVFRLPDDEVLAIDDRCPHEGYPLAKGFLNGCVVTCRWHAFRYDLKSGKCLVGDEHARTYPVRLVEGEDGAPQVEVDLSPQNPEIERARHLASLRRGLERRRTGQIARDIVRLLDTGVSPREVAMLAVRYDAVRAPYGTTHVPALAHDVLALLPGITARHGADGEVATLLLPLDLAAEAHLGYAARERPAPVKWDRATAFAELRRRVEAEDADGAEALLRGAIEVNVGLDELRRWFRTLVCDHLLDFGHGQIYLPKVFALLEGVGPGEVDLVLGAYLRGLALATREELVPEWSWVARALDEPAEVTVVTEEGLAVFGAALLDGSRRELCEALEAVIAAERYEAIVDVLVIAASERVLRYDLQIETDPTVQEGWLDVTHALTLASALRDLYAPDDPTGNRRLLYFASAFVHTRGGLDAPPDLRIADIIDLPPVDGAEEDTAGLEAALDLVQHALGTRDGDAMVQAAAEVIAIEPSALVHALEDWCLVRGATRPIFSAHQWKTLVAAAHELARLRTSERAALRRRRHLPLLAAARFIASPLTERAPMQAAHEAVRFVRESRVPRKRT